MKMIPQAQKVVNSLKKGRQPAKNTTKWILESLEQGLVIQWNHSAHGWEMVQVPLTSAEKMTALRKRRAAVGIVERTYWGKEPDHAKMKKIESALLARIKKAKPKGKKIET